MLCDAPHGMVSMVAVTRDVDIEKTTRYQTIRMIDELDDLTGVGCRCARGASDNSIAFVAAADRVIIVLVGEPTSFLDAYSLIKLQI